MADKIREHEDTSAAAESRAENEEVLYELGIEAVGVNDVHPQLDAEHLDEPQSFWELLMGSWDGFDMESAVLASDYDPTTAIANVRRPVRKRDQQPDIDINDIVHTVLAAMGTGDA